MSVLRYRRPMLEAIFIVTEALAWFSVIAVMVAILDRTFLDVLIDRLQMAITTRQLEDYVRATVVLGDLRSVRADLLGLSWLAVVGAAFGGFLLMRLTQQLALGPALGSLVLIAGTVLGVNLFLHLSLGNFEFWDTRYLADMVNRPGAQGASGVDLVDFVARGSVQRPYGNAIGLLLIGLTVVWFRFMVASRSPIRIERMGRSFTASFLTVIVMLLIARAVDVAAVGWVAVPQFLLGMLGLAVANHERAVPASEGEERATPWLTSVGGTLLLLLVSVSLVGMFTYLQAGAVLSVIGDVLLTVVRTAIIVVIAPFFWVFERVLSWIFDGRVLPEDFLRAPQMLGPLEVPEELRVDRDGIVHERVRDTLKFLTISGVVYAMYRVGRLLLGRRRPPPPAVEERRVSISGGAGMGHLLADLLTFRRGRRTDEWISRHSVYDLFARAVRVSRERGLQIRRSETPEEFGRVAVAYLNAGPIAESAQLFERARYGRHYATAEEVQRLSEAIGAWSEANPATEEIRERVRGLRPTDEGAEIAMRVALMKKGMDPTNEALFRGE
ncbi:MAG: DUF4129 domain-containing protein [Chloroflexi bacterium]|nr:DUF4129 domain-containing protein [Chloroflexota bacterium]MQC16759.1 DUF4129 domain-containing protein [Chloroflexota bacterium]